MNIEWNTDMMAAPRGEDLLVTRDGVLDFGMLLWEPMEREPDDTDDDVDGYWGEHEGAMGVWFWWTSDGDGYTDKKYITAWAPKPAPYAP